MVRQQLYASFPWYDLPEMHGATDALWDALRTMLVRRGVGELPPALDRTRPHGTDWEGACVFTQTCGYPLFTTARTHFAVLGAPCYTVPGCAGPLHRSYIVVRAASPLRTLEDLRATRFAVNELDSNSGMNLPRRLFAPLARNGRFFASTVVTGSHAASAALVSAGGADAAAIDCVTFALLARYRPAAVSTLRVVAETPATPTPPLVTSRASSPDLVAALRESLAELIVSPQTALVRAALFLDTVAICDEEAYDIVMDYEREAADLGYPALA